MTVSDISVPGLNGIRQWEGRALRAYQDEVGVWTIGYGITNYDKNIGFKVGPGVTITAEQAEQLLYSSLRRNYLPAVERTIQLDRVSHAQGALDGGLSFHYNTGGIVKATWPKRLNAGDVEGTRASLESWNKAGGRVLPGLTRRRAWEWNVISRENYGHMEGPEELNAHERAIGHGELLTALPGHAPAQVPVGDVHVDGPPTPTIPAPSTAVLQKGASGASVDDLQGRLNKAGYPTPTTGTFDDATEASVRKLQEAHPQITVDGKVGPATNAALTRTVDLQRKVGTVTKTAPVVAGPAAILWNTVSGHAGTIALVVGAVVVITIVGYVVWTYRHEASGILNKARGKVTV